MANKKPNWAAWALRFVGSLAFLAVVWQLWGGVTAPVSAYATSVFAPVLFGIAVVSSVSLFLGTLAALAAPGKDMGSWNGKLVTWSGFSLLALLTVVPGGWATWSWIALVGFVLAFVGVGMDMM